MSIYYSDRISSFHSDNIWQVQTRFLSHTSEQAQATTDLYANNRQDCQLFIPEDLRSQECARNLLLQLGLDRPSRSSLDSRWNVQWSNSWIVGPEKEGDTRKRILFQWYLQLIVSYIRLYNLILLKVHVVMIQRQGKLGRRKSQGFPKQDLLSAIDECRLILLPV
jgi:hypothetical protein